MKVIRIDEIQRRLKEEASKSQRHNEFQDHVDSIIEKIPEHSERFISLSIMIQARINELRILADKLSNLRRYQEKLLNDLSKKE